MQMLFTRCAADGCEKNAHRDAHGTRGFCSLHYHRVRKYGDPTVRRSVPRPAQEWLAAHASYLGDDCLTWPLHVGADGYGRAHHWDTGRLCTASRLMCILAHGEPPTPKHQAAHSCGNGNLACANPKHLYWATHTINQADREAHGTTNRGERQGQAKLTSADVLEIVQLLGSRSQTAIASTFGVNQSHISNIKRGKQWGWLTGL